MAADDLPGGAGNGFGGASEQTFSVGGRRVFSMGSQFRFDIPGLGDTTRQLHDLRIELEGIDKAAQSLSRSGAAASSVIGGMHPGTPSSPSGNSAFFGGMGGGFFAGGARALAGMGSGGGGGGGIGAAPGGAASPSFRAGNPTEGFSGLNNILGGIGESGGGIGGIVSAIGNLLLTPVRLAYNRVEENRASTLNMARYLGPVASRSGGTIEDLITTLRDNMPVRGSLNDQLEALRIGGQYGYTLSPGTQGRSGGFFESVRQLQQLNPGASAGSIAGSLAGYAGNTSAVQTSVMLSGGAFSFQGAGGRMRSFQEWAEGLLRFFQNQRPGAAKGKAFTKEELESQQFQGSNFNTWFAINQVPQDLVDAFWQYVISRANAGTAQDFATIVGMSRGEDIAFERLQGQSAQARRDYALSSSTGVLGAGTSMYRQYGQRERSDTEFQGVLSNVFDSVLGKITGSIGGPIAGLPSPIADILYQLFMKLPDVAGLAASALPFVGGAIGDPGYGPEGGTTTNGLTPDMAQRVQAMMRDNPNLRIVSGMRDGGTQHRLNAAGYGYTAPVGQSTHSRGWSADLGPTSEYGWIAANAHRYGLQNAAGSGEPWHVGLPGTVPVFGDPVRKRPGVGDLFGIPTSPMDLLGSLGSGLGSMIFGPLWDVISFTGSMAGGLMDLMKGDFSGLFGQGGPLNPTDLGKSLSGGLLSLLGLDGLTSTDPTKATSSYLGWLTGSGGKVAKASSASPAIMQGGAAGGAGAVPMGGPAINAGGVSSVLAQAGLPAGVTALVLSPADQMRALQALQADRSAGFSGASLVTMAAIQGKESGFNPQAHAVGPVDDSYGLSQINMKGSLGPARRKQWALTSNEQLYDPATNAKAAWDLSNHGTNWQPWGLNTSSDQNRRKTAGYVPAIYDLAKQAGYVGDPRLGRRMDPIESGNIMAAFSPTTIRGGHTFQISVPIQLMASGGRGDTDLRRVAGVLADMLPDEIEKALVKHG